VRIGVIGGTFDPIHLGHLIAAEEVRSRLNLQKVLFVPAGEPPHKKLQRVSPAFHRVRMVELSISTNPFFELSLVDVNRPGISYTVETLEILKKELGESTEIYFIIGMDSLAEIVTWKEPERLISLARLAVVNRPPYPTVDVTSLEEKLPGVSGRVDMVSIPGIYIASSDLQERVANCRPIKYQVMESVENYIKKHRLYVASSGNLPQNE
jgi:nicotinate-nucleotide adenylyltransferase